MSFPGTEHYREKANEVWLTEYGRDVMALCDHIEDLEKQNEQAWERAALEARRVLKNGSKALKLERQVGERDKEIERLREALNLALRHWRMYANDERQCDDDWIEGAKDPEALLYHNASKTLNLSLSTRMESSEEKP